MDIRRDYSMAGIREMRWKLRNVRGVSTDGNYESELKLSWKADLLWQLCTLGCEYH